MMNRLWAPWRKAYIRPKKRVTHGCLFCRLAKENRDAQNYIIKRSRLCFALLNLFPYNNGHVMVLPYRHVSSFDALTDAEKLDWLSLASEITGALKTSMNAHGFNLGVNMGKTAGAGIPDHLHLHIVPRWEGDHNFMPVVGSSKVISESLKSAYVTLRKTLHPRKTRKK